MGGEAWQGGGAAALSGCAVGKPRSGWVQAWALTVNPAGGSTCPPLLSSPALEPQCRLQQPSPLSGGISAARADPVDAGEGEGFPRVEFPARQMRGRFASDLKP